MLVKLKSYISAFFLLAFLFPSVIKEVHTTHHEEKVNCDAKADKHFHESHHDCTFCDFVLPIASAPSKAQINFSLTHFAEYVFPHLVEVYFSSSHFSSAQLRAPPVLS